MRFPIHRLLVALLPAALVGGCSSSGSITGPIFSGDQVAYVLTSDFSTGGLSVIHLDSRAVAANVATVHSDAAIRVYGGLVYVVNRFAQGQAGGDNIQVINPRGYTTIRQFSTGNGSNPQDIAFASPIKAYVSRYGSAGLLVVDPRSGLQIKTISLAAFADSDGLPEMGPLAMVGPLLFVACQRLTNFTPANPSVVAVIDTRTDALLDTDPLTPGPQGIALTGRNPFTDFVHLESANELLIGCAGAFGASDGGIERIDTQALVSRGYAITEAALGGDVLDVAWNGSDHSYAIVGDAAFNASLVSWSATTSAVLDTVYSPGGFSLSDCAVNARGELYVCDNRFTDPGVRVFDAGPDTSLAGPLDTGLPPSRIAFR